MRLSFLGGTSDYPEYFYDSDRPGAVLGTAINQYVYVSILAQPLFEKIKFRFSWRFTESVSDFEEISHPVLRKALEIHDWAVPLNIGTMASLPGRSGMGSSSAFTVALLGSLQKFRGGDTPSKELAHQAIQLERIELGESGGWQDQFHSAIGGFRLYQFAKDKVDYSEQIGTIEFRNLLSNSLVLVATGGGRDSTIHASRTKSNILSGSQLKSIDKLSDLTREIAADINGSRNPEEAIKILSQGLNEGWHLKKKISGHSELEIDELLEFGLSHGALGAKLCGAGGSGFAAFIVPPEVIEKFIGNFDSKSIVRVELNDRGYESWVI